MLNTTEAGERIARMMGDAEIEANLALPPDHAAAGLRPFLVAEKARRIAAGTWTLTDA